MTNLDGTKTSDEMWQLANDPEASRKVALRTIEWAMETFGWSREEATKLFWCPEPEDASLSAPA